MVYKVGLFYGNGKKQILFQFIKNDKESLASYYPISLLPICEKTFEPLLYNEKFNLLITNHLISTTLYQSTLIN